MDSQFLFYLGGIYHICWAIFDSFWPRLFNWKKTLAPLDDFNRALLYILSRLLVLLYLYLAWISFYYSKELLKNELGKTIVLFVVFYWVFRAFMQVQFFGFERANKLNIKVSDVNLPAPVNLLSNKSLSILFFVIMMIGILLYSLPMMFTS